MNIAGFSLSNWMTYGFSFTQGSVAWRFPIAFQLLFSVVLFSTVPWLPESPRWLLAHGYTDEGVSVLVALDGPNATPKDDIIVNQRDAILEAVRIEQETAPTWRDIMKGNVGNTGMIQRLILGAGKEQSIELIFPNNNQNIYPGTQWMQQLVGINVTSY